MPHPPATHWKTVLAWCVHAYTALGLVAAAGIAVCIYQGTPGAFRLAFALMLAATVIDGTDGTLARRVQVKKVLPGFDGRRLDDIIDFHTYTTLPLLLIWRAELLPAGTDWVLLLPLLASAYGFCQVAAKTADGYFLGFPSYWNLIAFYLVYLRLPPEAALGVLVVFALLTFVPARYLYPTMAGTINRVTNCLGAVWAVLLAWILVLGDEVPSWLPWVSFIFPAYYLLVSWAITLRIWWQPAPYVPHEVAEIEQQAEPSAAAGGFTT